MPLPKTTLTPAEAAVFAAAKAAYEAAKEAARLSPSPETRAAVHAAWNAAEAVAPRQKRSGYASRAGKRQRAELLASMRGRR